MCEQLAHGRHMITAQDCLIQGDRVGGVSYALYRVPSLYFLTANVKRQLTMFGSRSFFRDRQR